MGVVRYDITEASFSTSTKPNCELSILTGMDSSSYLIANENQEVQVIRSLVHEGNEAWWSTDERVTASYRKVRLAWLGGTQTLVPSRLYNGDERRSYLERLTVLSASETVLADPVPELNAFLVYAIEQERLDQWRRQFIGCRFYHVLSPVLHHLAALTQRQARPAVFAYIKDQFLMVAGLERGQLLFCNIFPCQAAKDFLYFTLLAYEQCQWKPDKVPLRLFGEVLSDSEIYRLLFRYIREVTFLTPAVGDLRFGPVADEQPHHFFYDLASLHLYH